VSQADINHEIKIKAAASGVLQALTSASELTKWHTSRTEKTNGKDEFFTTHTPRTTPTFEWQVIKPGLSEVEGRCVQAGELCGHEPPV